MRAKGRANGGRSYGVTNHRAVLTEDLARLARYMVQEQHYTIRHTATVLGATYNAIHAVVTGRTWTHVRPSTHATGTT